MLRISLTCAWLLPLQRPYSHGLPLAGAILSRCPLLNPLPQAGEEAIVKDNFQCLP